MFSLRKQNAISFLAVLMSIAALLFVSLLPASARNQDEAIGLVRQQPEVRDWLKLFDNLPTVERKPIVELDHTDGDNYVVHAYEIVHFQEPNNMGGHTATFNWYVVNPGTGKVHPQF